jgi:hypothetical protein
MDTFSNGYKRKDNEAGCAKVMNLVQVYKRDVRNLSAENVVQNVCLLDSQILMLIKKGGQIFTLYETFGCGQHEVQQMKESI